MNFEALVAEHADDSPKFEEHPCTSSLDTSFKQEAPSSSFAHTAHSRYQKHIWRQLIHS